MINIKRIYTKGGQYRVKRLVTNKLENCLTFSVNGGINIHVFNNDGEELKIELDTELLDKIKRGLEL